MIQDPKENKIPLLFVHIPKTGGGTIKNYFGYTDTPDHTGEKTGHQKLAEIKKNFYAKNNLYKSIPFKNYFKFATFRNPWERILSEFNYRTRKEVLNITNPDILKNIKHWIEIINKKYTFKDWILSLHDKNSVEDLIERHSYFSYINLHGKIGVDYIINLHNLNDDFELIKKISNRTEDLNIIKANNGENIHSKKHEFFKTYYDDKTIELVGKIHVKDIELFNFSFENYEYADLEKFYNLKKIKKIPSF